MTIETPIPSIHIYRANTITRVRRRCPYHNHLCFGDMHEYYDTVRIAFDCGTQVDFGYGGWTPPPKAKCPKCRKWFRPLEMIEHLKTHSES